MRKIALLALFLFFAATSLFVVNLNSLSDDLDEVKKITKSPTPTMFEPYPYELPQIEKKRAYLTLLVGDSMIASLGENANPLREKLIEFYPDNEFVNYNYGFGATNILSLPQRLSDTSSFNDRIYPAILTQGFDLIIIGSFAYNPLSELSLQEGLDKQTGILDESVRMIMESHPDSAVVFITPIAPSRELFAEGVIDLSQMDRDEWIGERVAYIQNHINFAKEKDIPLINVYEQSLQDDGGGDPRYINVDDNIHPSGEGVDLMARTIAQFIYENEIFPH